MKPKDKTNWEDELVSLLEKQGLSPNDLNDEASQQIYFEDKKFISQLLHSQKQSIIEAVEKMDRKFAGLGAGRFELGYDKAIDDVVSLIKKLK